MGTQTILFYESVADTKEETVISMINDGELETAARAISAAWCVSSFRWILMRVCWLLIFALNKLLFQMKQPRPNVCL